MKIIRLAQDRIKVILSDDELLEMNIDIKNITPDSPELKIFLHDIMEVVQEEVGYASDDGRTMVEATIFSGGIVLIISRVKNPAAKSVGIRAVCKKDNIVFKFCGFDALTGFLINTEAENLSVMRLYQCGEDFYLAIPRNAVPIIIYEYAMHNCRACYAESVSSEYGILIADGSELINMVQILKKIK